MAPAQDSAAGKVRCSGHCTRVSCAARIYATRTERRRCSSQLLFQPGLKATESQVQTAARCRCQAMKSIKMSEVPCPPCPTEPPATDSCRNYLYSAAWARARASGAAALCASSRTKSHSAKNIIRCKCRSAATGTCKTRTVDSLSTRVYRAQTDADYTRTLLPSASRKWKIFRNFEH